MALSEKLRSSIYRKLIPVLGVEEAEAVVSYFPARDVEEPATKEVVQLEAAYLRAEMAELRTDLEAGLAGIRTDIEAGLAGVRTELQTGLAGVRTDLEAGLAGVRTEQQTGLAGVRTELQSGLAAASSETAKLRVEMHQTMNRMFIALVTLQLMTAGMILAFSNH